MPSYDFIENFKEMIKLIPIIHNAADLGVNRDLKAHIHDEKRLRIERKFLREGITLVQKKWIIDLLYILQFLKKPHFNEIKRALPEINSKTLTDRLRYLEEQRIILRTVETERPIRVIYELTEFGDRLFKLLLPFIYYLILPKSYKKKMLD